MPTECPRAQFTGCALGGVWEISGNEAFERFSPFRPGLCRPHRPSIAMCQGK